MVNAKHIAFFLTFCIFTLISYGIFIYSFSLNLPMWDDYDSALGFLNSWSSEINYNDRIQLLFSQHNEHRIVLTRLIELSYFKIFNNLNFFHLILISNVFLFVIIGLHVFYFYKYQYEYFWQLTTICLFLLLSPIQWEAQLWTCGGLQNFGQVMFSMATIFLIKPVLTKTGYVKIAHAALLLLFSGINIFIGGAFVPLFISISLFFLIKREYKLVTLSIFVYSAFFYFYFVLLNYNHSPHPSPSIFNFIVFFFAFVGNGLHIFHPLITLLCGLFIVILGFYFRKIILRNEIHLLYIIFFILVNLLTDYSRSYMDPALGHSSRYAIYSLILILFLIEMSLYYSVIRKFFTWIVFLCLLHFLVSFNSVLKNRDFLARYNTTKSDIFYPDISVAIEKYNLAKMNKIFSSTELDLNIEKYSNMK